jgi:excisionase family DNA binding protein
MVYFTVKETAELLKVHEETVRKWIRNNKIEAEQGIGRQGSKISSEALKKYLGENRGLINTTVATTLGIGAVGIGPAVGAFAAVPVIGAAAAPIAAVLSWRSILKSKNNDKAKMKIELLEKEEELNAYINQLKNDIATRKQELEIKMNELERVDKDLSRLTEVLREMDSPTQMK